MHFNILGRLGINAGRGGHDDGIATLSKNGFGLRSFERMRKRALLVFEKPRD